MEIKYKKNKKTPAVVLGGLTLIRPLGLVSIPVIMIDDVEEISSTKSRYVEKYYILDTMKEDEYINFLIEKGKELYNYYGEKIVLYYGNDTDLNIIYTYSDVLSRYYLFLINEATIRESLIDKLRFYNLAIKNNFLIPKTMLLKKYLINPFNIRYPIIVKPRVTYVNSTKNNNSNIFKAHQKAIIFKDRKEAKSILNIKNYQNDFVVQEYIEGGDDNIYSFHGFADKNNGLIAFFAGKKIRTYPKFTGQSSYLELIKDEILLNLGKNIVKRLNFKGVLKIDFKKDIKSGDYYILEINARYNLWHYLGAINGVNIPLAAYNYLTTGEKLFSYNYKTTHKWLDLYIDYKAFKELKSRGEINIIKWIYSLLRHRKIYNVFSWRDPIPFIKWWIDWIKKRYLRLYQ